ncbi:hypothetical protein [Shewanella algae]|uniref:AAA family ATPase n=2 Tax=Unclassified Bacteria TaxID=49928 RepID=A0AAU6VQ74_UNCXX|nr:hypothetical protein [Shewanella algae]MCT8982268.1 hypothetical protein [Shewanella algae]QHD53295.1 hypothetical protein GM320_09085 [Shewanella algae]
MNSNNNSRRVIGFLDTPKPMYGEDETTKISKGFIDVLFEEGEDGTLTKINSAQFFDDIEKVFVIDGFQESKTRYHRTLIAADVILNNLYEGKSDVTRYVTFKNNISEFSTIVFGMLHMKLPSPLDCTDIILPTLPSTRSFYVVDDGFAYGPFKFEPSNECRQNMDKNMSFAGPYEGSLRLSSGIDPLNTKPSYISKIDYRDIESHLTTVHGSEYLLDASVLKQARYTVHQYMMRNEVMALFKKLQERRKITGQVVAAVRLELQNKNYPLTPEGKEVIYKICEAAADDTEWQKAIMDIVSNDERGKKLIESYVEASKENYIANWDKIAAEQHTKKSRELKEVEQRLAETKAKVAEQDQLLVNKQNEYDALLEKAESNEDLEQRVQERRQELDSQIQESEAELARLKAEHKQLAQYGTMAEAFKALETQEAYLNNRKNQLEQSIQKVEQTLRTNESELQTQLRQLVPFVSTIIQAPIASDDKFPPFSMPELQTLKFREMSVAQTEISRFVNYIANQLANEYNRSYSNEFISSVLVAQAQSLISIFTGAPGLGKTSFVRLLKRILKMDERFLEVPVGRSWVSEREFIGFFNSLSNSFSPSSSGVYQFLKGLSKDQPETAPLSLMLLDEANLSAIEHYGAFLINISDDEAEKMLRLSKEEIVIPESLRIVATINHDLTTEALSPRLIDRAPVIPFDSFINDTADYIDEVESYNKLSYEAFAGMFGRKAFLRSRLAISDDGLPLLLEEALSILKKPDPNLGSPIILSLRKASNLKDYVYTLTSVLMVTEKLSDGPALEKAIDYGMLYYVLPSIQGAGTGTKQRLEQLSELLDGKDLELSSAKLKDILLRGEHNLETYNFFHY